MPSVILTGTWSSGPATDQDFSMLAGQDLDITFEGITGTDTTAANALQFIVHDHSGSEFINKTDSGGDVTAPSSDKVQVTLVPNDTESASAIAYRLQLWVKDTNNDNAPVATGQMKVERGFS